MSATSTSIVKGFLAVPEYLPDSDMHRRVMARALNNMLIGKFNCLIDVTLNAATGATVISDSRIGYSSAVTPLMPLSLAAALDIGTIWFDPPVGQVASTAPSIVMHHRIDANPLRVIRFGIFG